MKKVLLGKGSVGIVEWKISTKLIEVFTILNYTKYNAFDNQQEKIQFIKEVCLLF